MDKWYYVAICIPSFAVGILLIVLCCYYTLVRTGAVQNNKQKQDQKKRHDEQIKLWLSEVVPRINEDSRPISRICESILEKWRLPLHKYNYQDAAFLLYHLHMCDRVGHWTSVRQAAVLLLESYKTPELRGKLKLTKSFTKLLWRIQLCRRSALHHNPMANVYVLLKQKSRNVHATDYSPESGISSEDLLPFGISGMPCPLIHSTSITATATVPANVGLPSYAEALVNNDTSTIFEDDGLPSYVQATKDMPCIYGSAYP